MKSSINGYRKLPPFSHFFRGTLLFLLAFALSGCGTLFATQDPALRETQIELNVQQTLAAQQATQQGSLDTSQNQNVTLAARSADETRNAQQTLTEQEATQAEETVEPPQETAFASPDSTENPLTESGDDFKSWMQSANILLYEDMINNPNTNRYVKDTLAGMGIDCTQRGETPCQDVGSAQGWFRDGLASGAPGGKPWDLVIVSSENKTGQLELKSSLPSDFFDLVLTMIDQGIPIILEVGNLDKAYPVTAKELMERCGVEFESNWIKIPPSRMVMFPLLDSHPILLEPNSNLSFSEVTNLWTTKVKKQYYDIGDLVRLSPGSAASLLVGTVASETTSHGTLTVCMDDLLILQTFSSHQLTYNSMRLVWENYIYNQLKLRYSSLQ